MSFIDHAVMGTETHQPDLVTPTIIPNKPRTDQLGRLAFETDQLSMQGYV
jgi:hypothetical protein